MLLAALPKAVNFNVPDLPAPPPAAQSAVAQPVSVQMLVTLASVEPAVERRRRVAIEAGRALNALDRLNDTLVAGLPPVERLREVAAWAGTVEVPEDPQLAAILKDIDLRVRVELAKHEKII